jgi:AcrR family transcriptional regulator
MTVTSTPPLAGPHGARRADATRNRVALLDAARTVLALRGLDVPVEEIARAAGVGVGTVYRNFPTKDALVGAVIERAFDELTAASVAALGEPDPGEAFYRLLHESAAVMARDIVLVRAARAGTDLGQGLPASVQRLFDATGAVLDRAIAAGAVRPGITARDVSALLIGVGEAANHPAEPGTDQVQRYVTILSGGLRPREQPA